MNTETLHTITETRLVPPLRFVGFDDEWNEIKLSKITSKIGSGKTPKGGSEVYQNEGIPFIRSQNVINGTLELDSTHISEKINSEMKSSMVRPDDILLNITGASIGRTCVVPANFERGNVNQHVCIVRLKDKFSSKFLQSFLSSFNGQKLVLQGQTGSGREGLNFRSIGLFKVAFPTLPEQQKIASFLTAVDTKLQQLNQKKELLQQYKKGVMQQLFSQKLRFKIKNEVGELVEPPDWEEKKLGEIFKAHRGKGIAKGEVVPDGKNKCVLYGELYTHYNEVIYEVRSKTDSNDGLLSEKSDILIPSSTTTTGIDLANVTAIKKDGVLLGGDIIVLRGKTEISNIFYAYYLTNYKKFEIASRAQGITIVHLYYSGIKDIFIDLPSIKEQQQIASYLSALDTKIETVTQQIETTQQFKKGLLQQMFV